MVRRQASLLVICAVERMIDSWRAWEGVGKGAISEGPGSRFWHQLPSVGSPKLIGVGELGWLHRWEWVKSREHGLRT